MVETVSQGTQEVQPPTSERHAREIAKLKIPTEQVAAWREAVRTAPRGRVTTLHVATVVRGRLAVSKPSAPVRSSARSDQDDHALKRTVVLLQDMNSALDDLLGSLGSILTATAVPSVAHEMSAAIDTTMSKLGALRLRQASGAVADVSRPSPQSHCA